ncbi:MAG TPA: hypothetical protein VGH33_22360 [Isosphaeraceae bacterium]
MSDMGTAPSGGLAVFVTSHGFGHLNRAVAVLNQTPPSIPITIFTDLALFGHWRERLQRPARLEARPADFGAYNPPGDSLTTDGPATIARAVEAHRDALSRLDDDVAALRDGGHAAVLCDAPSMPLVAARRAGIPGYLLANFTWADIYEEHAGPLGNEAQRFVGSLRDEIAQATAIFRAEPALPMTGMAPLVEVGMVVTPGRDRGEELRERLGLASGDRLVYFYVGRYGQDRLGWERLARLGNQGIHFVGFHPAPSPLANFHVVPAKAWTGADLAASSDVAVAKAGYGTVCETIVAGTPLVYPPRSGFAEHTALEWALEAWGGGVRVDPDDFRGLRLDAALDLALSLRPGIPPYPTDGARRVARHLANLFGMDVD